MTGDTTMPMGPFPDTEWTLVFRAAQDGQEQRQALADLLRRYLPALKAHLVRRKKIDRDRANDLVQGFAADKIVERDLLRHVTGKDGKFRTFLLTSLDRYVISQWRREGAQKRSPKELRSMDQVPEPGFSIPDPFDVAWAREVVGESLRQMQAECRASERVDIWQVFECRIVTPILDRTEPPPYGEVVRRFGFRSPAQASNVLVTAKRMFARIIRAVVADYVKDERGIDTEIGELREILAAAPA
ncbi:hypothetical protein LCGC14_1412500 [marine sediment metagenome]|uniref:RNA polymerase sigma-70 region 2 domain-containing protein n=1 Tax=marine sediment metagenome TaxID=412755 RepID=A0A0F9JTU2_9ZZZZ